MASRTTENYLKQLYLEQQNTPETVVLMGKLAAAMGVAPGTATSMVKSLADGGFVRYEPRGGVRLTAAGEQLALRVLRRHRLVELFLVTILGLDWSEVHAEAEELEHVISDKVLERMDLLLGHPKADPHGDPIPSPHGQLPERQLENLAVCPAGAARQIARVLDQSPEFLQFVHQCGLTPGTQVRVQQRVAQADAVVVAPHGKAPVTLSTAAAAKFLVTQE